MACDMVVALGSATVGGNTLVGINRHGKAPKRSSWLRLPGRHCSPDEVLCLQRVHLPQARQTFTILGSQPLEAWGFTHGLNERHVVVGCAGWHTRVEHEGPGLLGTDLVRLTLERSHSAQHAVEVLTDLIGRYGADHVREEEGVTDDVFLLADGREAYVVEAVGRFWAMQECSQVRALSDAALIRQDWRRLAPGLAEHAITQGWWPDDGSKLDFAGRLGASDPRHRFALKRWGRATLLLEQQNGYIDRDSIRRLLVEHYEDTVVKRRPDPQQAPPLLETTFACEVPSDPSQGPIAWIGLGAAGTTGLASPTPSAGADRHVHPTGNEIFFPAFLEGELPPLLTRGPQAGILTRHPSWMTEQECQVWREELARMQVRLDQEAEDCAVGLAALKQQGNTDVVARQATAFMQAQAEMLDQSTSIEAVKPRQWLKQSDLAFVAE